MKENGTTEKIKVNLELGFKEIDMKEDQFDEVFKILRDLENTETHSPTSSSSCS